MAFSTTWQTRHTDTYAGTPFVHAGVLLSFTELAYAAFEVHCGVTKPNDVVAVQRETRAVYHAPLHWHDGAIVEVITSDGDTLGFSQEFTVRSAASNRTAAVFVHRWAWLDTTTGRGVEIPPDLLARLLAG
jgi:acyl-CoA thioesterase FadM